MKQRMMFSTQLHSLTTAHYTNSEHQCRQVVLQYSPSKSGHMRRYFGATWSFKKMIDWYLCYLLKSVWNAVAINAVVISLLQWTTSPFPHKKISYPAITYLFALSSQWRYEIGTRHFHTDLQESIWQIGHATTSREELKIQFQAQTVAVEPES